MSKRGADQFWERVIKDDPVGMLALQHILDDWQFLARPDQLPPPTDWVIWLLLGGRGAGKTRAGAEWVRAQVKAGAERIALVGPSYQEVRAVMLEGESGLLNLGKMGERPKYISSRRRLEWPKGAVGEVFSAEDPDGLRGPQFECAWADEFCAWAYPDATLSNLRLGLRLGDNPRLVMTTTPKPIAALTRLMEEPSLVVTRARTQDNKTNLSPIFMKTIVESYGGTRLGRQELDGEIMTDFPGALWSRDLFEQGRVKTKPNLSKIVIAIDPPVTSHQSSDACGIIVVGRSGSGAEAKAYVLQDATVQGARPDEWVNLAAKLYHVWGAHYVLAEINQGGDMIQTMFNTLQTDVAVRTVYATKSKAVRAEPVALLYERSRVHHVGHFPELEDELCLLGVENSPKTSPDRADALVWAVTDLLLKPPVAPQIRGL
ncbi:MAG TPA: ATP-binding protein [Hellea balneolensis]|uniref:ATP-binding protein n=1 Tax=Hellea balneolensis TaxID=287478 RepID=A0A7C5LTI6_9PROT|nr:ATP-binding protein [Hellea balneolensis]